MCAGGWRCRWVEEKEEEGEEERMLEIGSLASACLPPLPHYFEYWECVPLLSILLSLDPPLGPFP